MYCYKISSIFHSETFLPDGLDTFVCCVRAENSNDVDNIDFRRRLHSLFCLPQTRPIFRRTQQFTYDETPKNQLHLQNVHKNCNLKSGIHSAINGRVSVVRGDYGYYHYTQDNVDDSGWGCAYRSGQTIMSWLRLNGFTEMKSVPTHKQMQEALVAVGDRDAAFVGSRQWIGSLELSYIIDHIYSLPCRIVTADNGACVAENARVLADHFERGSGAPVMIGGGVLAHTILGVDFNQSTGECRFLVLDPHYTGEENIKTIVQKGWCNWKPVTFWQKDTFYNMLLVQPPPTI